MMNNNINRRNFIKSVAGLSTGMALVQKTTVMGRDTGNQNNSPAEPLKAPPLEVVRVGIIGVGARGSGHLKHYLSLEDTQINAICDIHEPSAKGAQARCVKAKKPRPTIYSNGDYDYRRMLERDDLDIVIIATPWRWHTPMAVDTMKAGKHAFSEVPAAMTVEECWQLVDTCEKTKKHCMMMENCCYGREEMMVLNMCRLGIFGELLHGECAYIHDLRDQMNQLKRGTGSWRTLYHANRNGNLYPTHGLGPVAQYMNINRSDRFDYMTSMSSPALGRAAYAKKKWSPDHPRNKLKYTCGDMNTSLIKTVNGRSIMVQHDTTTPRPYNRINFIQGTKGAFRGYPSRVAVTDLGNTHKWQDIDTCFKKYDHPLWTKMLQMIKKGGGHGGMDFLMNWRIVDCLRKGEPLDQDVYDAASWSAIGPLSDKSVADKSNSVEVPDFTRGKWKTLKPLGIIS